MEARLEGDDLEGLQQALKEYVLLQPRDQYADRLNQMKEQATRQQAESKTPVLSPNLQARFSELQALIDRYLDNEALQTYTESLDRKRAERAEAAKAKNSRKARHRQHPRSSRGSPGNCRRPQNQAMRLSGQRTSLKLAP